MIVSRHHVKRFQRMSGSRKHNAVGPEAGTGTGKCNGLVECSPLDIAGPGAFEEPIRVCFDPWSMMYIDYGVATLNMRTPGESRQPVTASEFKMSVAFHSVYPYFYLGAKPEE